MANDSTKHTRGAQPLRPKCGCVVFGSAQFCKMHAAAPALYEALKLLNDFRKELEADPDGWEGETLRSFVCKDSRGFWARAEAAIRKVEEADRGK